MLILFLVVAVLSFPPIGVIPVVWAWLMLPVAFVWALLTAMWLV